MAIRPQIEANKYKGYMERAEIKGRKHNRSRASVEIFLLTREY